MGHMGHTTEGVNGTNFLFENLIGIDHFENLGVDDILMSK